MTRAWRVRRADGWRVDAVESPAPPPEPGQVVIAVEAVAIGAVDLAIATRSDAPVPGRAAVGRVIAAGEQALELLERRVLVGPHMPCGECDVCRRGAAVVCPSGAELGVTARGALAERAVVAARWAVPLEGPLDIAGPAAALLGGDAALAYALYARAGIGPREPTVVLGHGPLARCLVEILAAQGAPPIVVVEDGAPASWSTWLESRGAIAVPGVGSFADTRTAVNEAQARRGLGGRPWIVLETTGDADHQTRAIAIAGPGATVVLAAARATGQPRQVTDLGDGPDRDVTVIGVAGAHPDLLVDVAALAKRGENDLAGATEVVRPDELEAALARRATTTPSTGLVVAVA